MATLSSSPFPLLTSQWLQAEGWERFPDLVHGFSDRIQDRAKALSQLEGTTRRLYTLKQVHGDEISVVTQSTRGDSRPAADGMITAEAGLLLGIATADCVPVLMVAPEQRVVAALHAGWRGTLKGVSVRAIEMLSSTWKADPGQLWVALGPSIGGCCYEVGRDVGEALYGRWGAENPASWRPAGGKGFLDLRAINRAQCERAGIPRAHVQHVGPCTFCDSLSFASYRREGANAGRQFSVIGWRRDGARRHPS
jgi:YfiH family protein